MRSPPATPALPSRRRPGLRVAGVVAAWLIVVARVAAGSDLVATPASVRLDAPEARVQVVVVERVEGRTVDRTREVRWEVSDPGVAAVSAAGLVAPLSDGRAIVTASVDGRTVSVPVEVAHTRDPGPVSFSRDIQPLLTKQGCNAGGCHGKAEGRGGFALSLFGFDDAADHAAIVARSRGRRLSPAAPEASLLLRKASAAEPHGGGRRIEPGSAEEKLLVRWIAEGAAGPTPSEIALAGIEVEPAGLVARPGETFQLRVVAVDAAGRRTCVTRRADWLSNAPSIAAAGASGIVTAGAIPGDAAILARYAGHVATVRVDVPRPGAAVARPPESGAIDRLVHDRLLALGIPPAGLCDDATFLRRASLDLAGVLPTADEARAFLADDAPDKRARLVDRLLDSPEHADLQAMRWADLLRADRSRVGPQGVAALTTWLRRQFRDGVPYDALVRAILTAEGPVGGDGPAAVFKALDGAETAARSMSQVFLGVRIECAQCHHHPSERWSQDDYTALAGFFTGVKTKPLPGGGEAVVSRGGADLPHPRSGVAVPAAALGAAPAQFASAGADRRRAFAEWATAPENPYLARAVANRLWGWYLGRGLVEPVDDLRATNPATNEPLLDHLERRLREQRFDLKAFTRELLASRAYQAAARPEPGAEEDVRHRSHAPARGLPAEVLLDAVCRVTDVPEKFAGWPEGVRAVEVWDTRLPSYFLRVFGRPVRATACECERGTEPSVTQTLHLVNSAEIQEKIGARQGRARRLASSSLAPAEIVDELFLAALSRFPTAAERATLLPLFDLPGDPARTRREATEDVLWTLLNGPEFLSNH